MIRYKSCTLELDWYFLMKNIKPVAKQLVSQACQLFVGVSIYIKDKYLLTNRAQLMNIMLHIKGLQLPMQVVINFLQVWDVTFEHFVHQDNFCLIFHRIIRTLKTHIYCFHIKLVYFTSNVVAFGADGKVNMII